MPNIIDSIQISSSTFDVRDKSATTVVNLTQDEYDNLPSSAKTANVLYNITDASPIDISQYWTSAQTNSAITQATSGKVDTTTFNTYSGSVETALSGKQDTLVSGTNIKTINNESILGEGNITIEGGSSVNVVQTTGTSTADVMSQSAVTTTKLDNVRVEPKTPTSNYTQLNLYLQRGNGGAQSLFTYVKTINGKSITSQNNNNLEGFSLIETSAITTSVTSSSTDSQVPSAKAVNDKFGGLSLVKLTQAQYNALATKDSNTLYIING